MAPKHFFKTVVSSILIASSALGFINKGRFQSFKEEPAPIAKASPRFDYSSKEAFDRSFSEYEAKHAIHSLKKNKRISTAALMNFIKHFEGDKNTKYKDGNNFSIGHGFYFGNPIVRDYFGEKRYMELLEDKSITAKEKKELFNILFFNAQEDAKKFMGNSEYENLPGPAKEVLIDLSYNRGLTILNSDFHSLRSALKIQNYSLAINAIMQTNYYNTHRNRALANIEKLRRLTN